MYVQCWHSFFFSGASLWSKTMLGTVFLWILKTFFSNRRNIETAKTFESRGWDTVHTIWRYACHVRQSTMTMWTILTFYLVIQINIEFIENDLSHFPLDRRLTGSNTDQLPSVPLSVFIMSAFMLTLLQLLSHRRHTFATSIALQCCHGLHWCHNVWLGPSRFDIRL